MDQDQSIVPVEGISNSRGLGETHSIELTRPLDALSESVSRAMPVLHSLHDTLFHAYGEHGRLTRRFLKFKDDLTSQLALWLPFLRHSLGYARNYALLCKLFLAGEVMEVAEASKDVISSASALSDEVDQLREPFQRSLNRFSLLIQPYRKNSYDSENEYLASYPRIIDSSYALPSVSSTFSESLSALRNASNALTDVAAFWRAHHSYLLKTFGPGVKVNDSHLNGFLNEETATWSKYQVSMQKAMSDVTSFSDLLAVTLVDRSNRWRRLFLAFVARLTKTRMIIKAEINTSSGSLTTPGMDQTRQAGYAILVSLSHYKIVPLIKSTSKLRGLNNGIDRQLLPASGDQNPLRSQTDRYFASLEDVEQIATKGAKFYNGLQKILLHSTPDLTLDDLLSLARDIHRFIQRVLEAYHEIYKELTHLPTSTEPRAYMRQAHTPDRLNSKLLRLTSDTLMQVIRMLIAMNDYWFEIAAGVEHLKSHGFSQVVNVDRLLRVWRTQEKCFRGYADEAAKSRLLRCKSI